jgi:hypothetical protein
MAVYTLFLLVALYHEYKREEVGVGGVCLVCVCALCALCVCALHVLCVCVCVCVCVCLCFASRSARGPNLRLFKGPSHPSLPPTGPQGHLVQRRRKAAHSRDPVPHQ